MSDVFDRLSADDADTPRRRQSGARGRSHGAGSQRGGKLRGAASRSGELRGGSQRGTARGNHPHGRGSQGRGSSGRVPAGRSSSGRNSEGRNAAEARRRAAARRNERARLRRRRRITTGIITVLLVTALTAAAVIFFPRLLHSSDTVRDYSGEGTGQVVVRIPEGATGRQIAAVLAEKNIVATEGAFIDVFSRDPRSTGIQAGAYTLREQMSASAALSALLDPANAATIKVTIPEGFTKWQVRDRLGNLMDIDVGVVEDAMNDAAALGLPAEAGGNVEGWLAPATYDFDPNTTVTEALQQMVEVQVGRLEASGAERSRWQAVLTTASIVEREGHPADYPKVARVIENRLGDNAPEVAGRLQMDSTVLYGVGKSGGVPTRAELDADNPYNTYRVKGLPPTAIGAPGVEAIEAAVNPAEGNWLYFTTVNLETGETKFTADYEEQMRFQAEFREWYAAHPDGEKKDH
ncbi:endolytic transglycosylase MltG [Actinotignum timonense]|uniref:endolytic transglycosylase MltG n=1 Tax=Actinotignum timonense TaxID=1870995 RepID=UPI000B35095C|nr:endolytic transglycosylase MltG [Actinotignum timonense]